MNKTPENETSGARSFALPLTLSIAVLVYLFSVGPVLTTASRFKSTGWYGPLRALYAPVFAVARTSGFGTRLYEGYVGLWCRIILKQNYPKYSPGVPVQRLITSIGSITNGQSAFQIFVPGNLSQGGNPISRDVAMGLIIGKVRQHGLYPAGFQEQPSGRLYTFEREREWERTRK